MRILNVVVFLAFVGSCVAQGSGRDAVCRTDNGYFPHDDYCDYYYECIDGVASLQLCPNGLVFVGKRRGLLHSCDYQKRGGCPDGVRVMGQAPIQTENCDWLWGRFPHKTSCRRYWECWNGTSSVHKCGYSLLYNTKSESCDWPENVAGCQQHPTCKNIPNGPIAVENSCSTYILCSGGYPYNQRCAAGLAFDPQLLSCKLAEEVPGCEPKPTEAPENEERLPPPPSRRERPAPPPPSRRDRPAPPPPPRRDIAAPPPPPRRDIAAPPPPPRRDIAAPPPPPRRDIAPPPRPNYQNLNTGNPRQAPPPSLSREINRPQYRPGK